MTVFSILKLTAAIMQAPTDTLGCIIATVGECIFQKAFRLLPEHLTKIDKV